MFKNNQVKIFSPKPFDVVELEFDIVGEVPQSWSIHGKYAPGMNWFSENGNHLLMSGPSAKIVPSFFSKLKNKVKFGSHISLYSKDPEHPHGIIIEVSGDNNEQFELFPFIIAGTNRDYDKEHDELRTRLSNAVERVVRLKRDCKNYRNELEKISRQRVWDKKFSEDIFQIIKNSEESFTPFTESEEDRTERGLAEKFKEAIRWEGPFLGGRAGSMEGFDFCVYSRDHYPKHFHIVHKGRGVDARFSYPQIELINYLGHSNSIGAKEIAKIKDYFRVDENLKMLEKEFQKQISY